ncbi:MAG TPA: hypothetical protein VGM67_19425 [Gemmatimonadaceae bacterium]|jgi:hypothetical protein
MSSFATTRVPRSRALLGAAAALGLVGLGACKSGDILNVKSPDVLGVGAYTTPAGVDPLRYGVIGDFAYAFDGNGDSFTVVTGNMADELYASDTFDDRLSINARRSIEVNTNMEAEYRALQQAHIGATTASQVMATAAPTEKWQRGEMYLLRGFTEIFFGEGWCSGTAFSSQDGATITYGQPNSTSQLFTIAAASFDSALALADTSTRVKYAAQVGKGRALLDNGDFAGAAAAVQGVPRTFQYLTSHSTASTREQNGMWNAEANGASRYSLVNNEGTNGLPYLTQGSDPRLPWAPSNRQGFNGLSTNLPTETKFGQTSSGIVADGTEAQLIILEAQLQGGTQADRDAVFAGLNALRTSNSKPVAAIAGSAPTDQASAVTQLFTERAYWMWLTGHRLGDLRRLVRQYGRDAESVFPTGTLPAPLAGSYGTSTSIVIPLNERNNPNFSGCLDTKA